MRGADQPSDHRPTQVPARATKGAALSPIPPGVVAPWSASLLVGLGAARKKSGAKSADRKH
jgi:hypothetical protein